MIKELLANIGIDKYEHFALASISACVLKHCLWWCIGWYAPLVAIIVVVAMCVGKEVLYDKKKGKGTPEWADLYAGIIGTLIGVL